MAAPPSVSLGIMWGDEYAITGADDAFLEIIGYSREDLARNSFDWRALTPPEHLHRDEAGMRQAERSGGFTVPYQKDFIRKDGTRVPVLLVCGFIPGAGRRWMGYVVNLASTAPGRLGENHAELSPDRIPLELVSRLVLELVRERGRMIAMLDSTPDQIWAVDRGMRLLGANAAFHAAFTMETGRTIDVGDLVIGPSDAPVASPAMWTAWYMRAFHGEQHRASHVVKTPAGDKHFEVQLSPIVAPLGGVIGATVVSRDVTARVEMEAAHRAATARTQLQEKLASLGTLAGGIAHDFNNLIGIILGYADLAVADPSLADEALASIRTASLRARDLVQQILAFGRRREHTAGQVDLVALVAETGNLLRGVFRPSLTFKVILPGSPIYIQGDATALQQVIVNLATNAEHALRGTEGGGVLEIAVERDATQARVRVADNGPGIPEAIRSRVFEPFFTTKQIGEGSGLGLSVVHGIVSLHGGEITCESEEGRGARFEVTFPLVAGAPLTPPARATSPPQRARRILLCEDETLLANVIARGLRSVGHDVHVVHTAAEALAAATHDEGLDLIITDLTMAGVTGDRLVRQLAERRPTVPILVVSGSADARAIVPDDDARCALLAKPFTQRELLIAVNALVSRSDAPAPGAPSDSRARR